LSDGLKEVSPDEADDVVIAGMGGELIRDILTAAPWVKDGKKHLVLQPMTHHDDLIRWLVENGFAIERQAAVRDDGKYYTVLSTRFTGDKTACDPYTALVGKLDLHEENSRGFLSRSLQNLRNKSKGDPSLLPIVKQLEEALYEAE
jgi:tRNA (adenine22-N1)-methyltransferase